MYNNNAGACPHTAYISTEEGGRRCLDCGEIEEREDMLPCGMDNFERKWLNNAMCYGGDFVRCFAKACLFADDQNFELLHPALDKLMTKYPKYSTMEDVK
jgi:hypothetical protein